MGGMQAVPPNAPTSAVQKVKEDLSHITIGDKLTVRKLDGTEYHGHLKAVNPSGFSIDEVDLKTVLSIPDDEVDRIRKNYGGKGFGGKRVDPKRNLIVATVFLGVLFTIVVLAARS